MKKRKKYNYERAKILKDNITKYNDLVDLPTIDNINFIKTDVINSVNVTKFNYNLIRNININLCTDDIINGRKKSDIFVKTYKIQLLPNPKQTKILLIWMDTWIDMYNKVLSVIKDERKQQSIALNKPLKYNEMNLDNLDRTKLKKDLHQFKKTLTIKTKIDSHILDYCINDVLTMLKSTISNLENNNCKKSKLRYIKNTKKSKIFKLENNGTTITKNSFCTSKLGKLLKSNPIVNYKKVNNTISTIQYKNGKFYMLIKKKLNTTKRKHPIKEQEILALDPGHRVFLSGLSNKHLIEIGKGVDKKIKKKLKKMDKIKSLKRLRHKRKYLLKHEKDLSNYINNFHWQVVSYITKNYNHILLGNYSTNVKIFHILTFAQLKKLRFYVVPKVWLKVIKPKR